MFVDLSVTPNQVYYLQLDGGASFCTWATSGTYGSYPDGAAYVNGGERTQDFLFRTLGFISPDLENCKPDWTQSGGATGSCNTDGNAALIFQPTHDLLACSIDFTGTTTRSGTSESLLSFMKALPIAPTPLLTGKNIRLEISLKFQNYFRYKKCNERNFHYEKYNRWFIVCNESRWENSSKFRDS